MTNNQKTTLKIVALATVIGWVMYCSQGDTETLAKIHNGELALYCNMEGQDVRRIDPTKVKDVYDFEGRNHYVFTNGWANRCYLEETN